MFKYAIVGLMVVALALAGPAPKKTEIDCKNTDAVSCYAVKALDAMNRMSRSAKVEMFDGAISVVRETPLERTSRALKSSEEIIAGLPQQPAEKAKTLAVQLIDTAASLMQNNNIKINPAKAAARFFGPVVTETIGAVADELNHGHHSLETKAQRILYKVLAAVGPYMGTALTLVFAKLFLISKVVLLVGAFFLFQKFFETTGLLTYLTSFFQPATYAPVNAYNNYASASSYVAQPPVYQPATNNYYQVYDKIGAEIPTADSNTLTQN